MAKTSAENFRRVFEATLPFVGRTGVSVGLFGESNFTTDWREASLLLQSRAVFVQNKCWTERFTGPLLFNPSRDSRHRIIRLKLDFWFPLSSTERELDALGDTVTAGQMNTDLELYGSPEYWRDVYPKFVGASVDGMDMDTPPVFSAENIGGLMMHWTISVALVTHNT